MMDVWKFDITEFLVGNLELLRKIARKIIGDSL
jgi:hypothetical protein